MSFKGYYRKNSKTEFPDVVTSLTPEKENTNTSVSSTTNLESLKPDISSSKLQECHPVNELLKVTSYGPSKSNEKKVEENSNLIEGTENFRCKYCCTSTEGYKGWVMTKHKCGGCKASLCKFPCFNLYHEEASLKCHQNNYVPMEMKSNENARNCIENAKLKARNKRLREKIAQCTTLL